MFPLKAITNSHFKIHFRLVYSFLSSHPQPSPEFYQTFLSSQASAKKPYFNYHLYLIFFLFLLLSQHWTKLNCPPYQPAHVLNFPPIFYRHIIFDPMHMQCNQKQIKPFYLEQYPSLCFSNQKSNETKTCKTENQ